MPINAAMGYSHARAVGNYVYQNRKAIASTLGSMFAKKLSGAPPPSQVLKGTALHSYLDRRYEKKCGTEIKQFYQPTTTGTPGTGLATLVSPFMGIAQGLTDATRVGDTIEVKKLRMRFTIRAGVASTANAQLRIIIVKQGNMSAAASAADILQTTSDVRSFYAQDKNEQFTILLDKTFTVTPLTTNDSKTRFVWDYVYKPKGCHAIKWTAADTTGVIANCLYGNINVKTMFEGAVAPTLDFYVHGEYVDA